MALYLWHFGNREENRNYHGINAVLVDATDPTAALAAARAAMPPGGCVTDGWTATLLSSLTPPFLIEGNVIPPGRRRGA